MSTRRWFVSILALILAAGSLAACGGAAPVTPQSQPVPQAQSSPKVPATPATPPVTTDQAIDLVRKDPDLQKYSAEVKAAGRRLAFTAEETPSRFVVAVSESGAANYVVTRWYLVSKKDGSVTEWDMSNGSVPED